MNKKQTKQTKQKNDRKWIFFLSQQMNLGLADLRTQYFNHVLPIVEMDNYSVITEKCQDLTITCTTSTVSTFFIKAF